MGVVHRADLRGPAEGSPGGWTPNMVLDDGGDATDVMLAGKLAVVCGYGNVGKGSAHVVMR